MSRGPLKEELRRSEPDPAALERVWSGVRAREQRSSVLPLRLVGVAAIAGIAVVSVLVLREPSPASRLVPEVHASSPVRVQLEGNSSVELEGNARFEPSVNDARVLSLHAGRAAFTLGAGPWVVTSRYLRVEVASAMFSVEVGGETDSVTVTRGHLRLSAPGLEELVLTEGQSFSTGASQVTWDSLAREGDLAGAWRSLKAEGVRAKAQGAAPELTLLLSDVAATGGDEALSRALLSSVMNAPDGGAERGLAAYTLGKRLQADGQRAAAAESFERSLELGVPVELRDDAARRAAQTRP